MREKEIEETNNFIKESETEREKEGTIINIFKIVSLFFYLLFFLFCSLVFIFFIFSFFFFYIDDNRI